MTDVKLISNHNLKNQILISDAERNHEEIKENQTDKLLKSFNLCNHLIEKLINDESFGITEYFECRPKPTRFVGIYDCSLYGMVTTYHACLSFYPQEIAKAIEITRECAEYCNQRRKKWSFSTAVADMLRTKQSYNAYTEEEAHAEMCYAGIMALRGVLNFIRDNNFLTMITGGLRFKAAYESIELCQKIAKYRKFENEELKGAFFQGTKLGVGISHLLLANIPKRLLSILQFIGYQGDREVGLKSLMDGCAETDQITIAGIICFAAITVYYLLLRYVLGNGSSEAEISAVEPLLNFYLQHYPNSIAGCYMKGRIFSLRGKVDEAMEYLTKAVEKPTQRLNIKVGIYCELACCHLMNGNYRGSANCMKVLRENSALTKCCFTYLEACYVLGIPNLTEEERQYGIELMKQTPELMVELCGQHIPFEKFVAKKAHQFFEQGHFLLFPEYEFLYLANFFMLVKFHPDKLQGIIDNVDKQLEALECRKDWIFYPDNYCLGMLIKGVCLKYLGDIPKSRRCFQEIINRENDIFSDVHVAMGAHLEMGNFDKKAGNPEEALKHFKAAKKKNFLWLEFRLHQAKYEAKKMIKAKQIAQRAKLN
ncbi:Tetratricopeptide repeat protein 39B [Chamberlinius hualienensis]